MIMMVSKEEIEGREDIDEEKIKFLLWMWRKEENKERESRN